MGMIVFMLVLVAIAVAILVNEARQLNKQPMGMGKKIILFLSPLKVLAFFTLFIAVYAVIKPGDWGFGTIIATYLTPAACSILIIDLLLRYVKNKKLYFILEYVIAVAIVVGSRYLLEAL